MKTKEKILYVALSEFNAAGLRNTTTRTIATRMGISPGNLHYHFKHTEDIILSLFDQLIYDFDMLLLNFEYELSPMDMKRMEQIFISGYEIVLKYKFFFINFVEISVWIPKIRDRFSLLLKRREIQIRSFCYKMVKDGIFRDDIPNDIWKYVVINFFIISDFWLSHNIMSNNYEGKTAEQEFSRTLQTFIYPYLKR